MYRNQWNITSTCILETFTNICVCRYVCDVKERERDHERGERMEINDVGKGVNLNMYCDCLRQSSLEEMIM